MRLSQDLLHQSRTLFLLDKRRPKQASLRRAVSTAYYAAFHLLLEDATQRMSPTVPIGLRSQFARAFQHGEMKQVCIAVKNGTAAFGLGRLQPSGFSDRLRSVAAGFVRLQEERHRADYDTGFSYLREQVEEVLVTAEELFRMWKLVSESEEANVFCAALLLGTRWAK